MRVRLRSGKENIKLLVGLPREEEEDEDDEVDTEKIKVGERERERERINDQPTSQKQDNAETNFVLSRKNVILG